MGNTDETREREQRHAPEKRLPEAPLENKTEEIHDTHLKVKPESHTKDVPRRIQRTREASREEALALTQQFFATVDKRNQNISYWETYRDII